MIRSAAVLAFFQLWICAYAFSEQVFTIGTQNIDYSPHYHFDSQQDKGYAWAVMEAFAEASDLSFNYASLPIKRLQVELQKGSIDFVYPDNPIWNSATLTKPVKHYSSPMIVAIGGTIVLRKNKGRPLESYTSLALPFGFNPIQWKKTAVYERMRRIATPDALSALNLVALGRVDAADVEYNVMRFLRGEIPAGESLTLDKTLPYNEVAFQVSTIRHPDIVVQLSEFLKSNQSLLAQIRERYGLLLPEEVNKHLTSDN